MTKQKVLFLVPWEVKKVNQDDLTKYSANLLVQGEKYWFLRHWRRQGLDVKVRGINEKSRVISWQKRYLRLLFTPIFPLLEEIRKADLLFCFHSQLGLSTAFCMKLLGIKKPLVLFDVEGIGRKNKPWQRWFVRQALNKVSLVFYLARVQKDDYEKYYPEILNRAEFLPFGVDLSRFPYREQKTENYILSIGYQDSNFRDWKTLLRAFNLFSAKTKLVIVGRSGFSAEEIGNSTLENVELIKTCNLSKLNEYVLRSKFVVLPFANRRQALGQMTLLGSMALGKAVVVSKVPGIRDYVTDGQDGLFYQAGNPYDLAEKINHLLSNPRRAEELGNEAKNSVENEFNEQAVAIRIFETLKKRDLMEVFAAQAIDRSNAMLEAVPLSEEFVS